MLFTKMICTVEPKPKL